MDGQPYAEPPNKICRTMINMIAINATPHIPAPKIDEIYNGVDENATMPSSEYLNSFQKDHLVSPRHTLYFFIKVMYRLFLIIAGNNYRYFCHNHAFLTTNPILRVCKSPIVSQPQLHLSQQSNHPKGNPIVHLPVQVPAVFVLRWRSHSVPHLYTLVQSQ